METEIENSLIIVYHSFASYCDDSKRYSRFILCGITISKALLKRNISLLLLQTVAYRRHRLLVSHVWFFLFDPNQNDRKSNVKEILEKRNSYPANELPFIKQKLGLSRFNVIMSQKIPIRVTVTQFLEYLWNSHMEILENFLKVPNIYDKASQKYAISWLYQLRLQLLKC